MKGTAKTTPQNHVEWINGFRSNMPDWQTARRCAHSDRLLFALKEARSVIFAFERGEIDEARTASVMNTVHEAIAFAEGMEELLAIAKEPNPILNDLVFKKSFPPPPGFKK